MSQAPEPDPNIPIETLTFFQSLPWTASLLSSPLYHPLATPARIPKPTTEDAFFAQTLSTPSTIPHSLTLLLRDLPPPPPASSSFHAPFTGSTGSLTLPIPSHPSVLWLIALGSPGISGHPYTAHGGFLTAVLDETLGITVGRQKTQAEGRRAGPTYTARLDTHYKRPVKVPGVYVASAWCTGRAGRKTTARGRIQDEAGNVYAEAEGLWVDVKTREGAHL